MSAEPQFVKRGPGRPRKNPIAPPAATQEPARVEPAATQFDPDERIGLPVDDAASAISYPDGREYRCENGQIAARIN